eukprot:TRINITY_DN4449_c0_g1_i2.p1 TRINITY_DN4449_c0_g1~~TRINITY_DN4449_c0_g1_i2.p1  ORF type:complete len:400 (+),score=85.53 TRINITY_DN4449_c0_g1_i2:56-1255(+)
MFSRKALSAFGAFVGTSASIVLAKELHKTDANTHPDYPPFDEAYTNLMAKYLTPELYKQLKYRRTTFGVTVDDVIQAGVDSPSRYKAGLLAGDEESYDVFWELFDPVINERHGYSKDGKQEHDLDHTKLEGGLFDEKYVLTARVRTGRSLRGVPMTSHCTRGQRKLVEDVMVKACSTLTGELAGSYKSIGEMGIKMHEQLIKEHIMFDKPDAPLMLSGMMHKDWPHYRGMFWNPQKTFMVWVNEEDHYRFVCMQNGGNIRQVFERFATGVLQLTKGVEDQGYSFMKHPHYGYLTCCPSNIGTGVRAGVHVRIPKMSKHPQFRELLTKMRLDARGTGGVEDTSTDSGGVFDISNKDRLGKSELQLVQICVNGVAKLVELEKQLESGGDVSSSISSMPYLK